MSTHASDYPVAPLVMGRGARELEAFLEPTCPHSKRAFEKFPELLAAVGEENLTIAIRLHSQPWHMYSGVVTRAVLAASARENGTAIGLKAMAGIYENRMDFEFEEHCHGPNMTRTPTDLVADISRLAGVDLAEAFCFRSVDQAVRWHTKYCRQNGIHVSPTFAIDRIVEPGMGSRQSIEEWAALLKLPVGTVVA
jgi:hypothetical protein